MRKTVLYSALILLSALFIAPFYWTFMTAIKSTAELYQFPPVFWPSEWHWENFAAAWNKQPFGTYLANSVIVVVL
jgi:multiple sugar transport system permease protein